MVDENKLTTKQMGEIIIAQAETIENLKKELHLLSMKVLDAEEIIETYDHMYGERIGSVMS